MNSKSLGFSLIILLMTASDLQAKVVDCTFQKVNTCKETFVFNSREVKSTVSITKNVDAGWPLLTRALWRLFIGVSTNVVSDWVINQYKGNVENNAQQVSDYYVQNYSNPQVRSEADHILAEWRTFKSGNQARNHVASCSVCNQAVRHLASGTPVNCQVPKLRRY